MEKPFKHTTEAYNWREAVKFIESKYGIDIRNYANYKFDGNKDVPYQDFWHSICEPLHNGCYLYIDSDWGSEDYFDEEWERKIAQLFVDEFVEDGSATFWVAW